MPLSLFKRLLRRLLDWILDHQDNPYHPLVWINGKPIIGMGTYIGGYSEIYAKGAEVKIGNYCDIASFVVINCADSSKRCVGLSEAVEKLSITIGDNVFIGTQSAILGGTVIGHNSIIGAGVILKKQTIPPYSLVYRDRKSGKLVTTSLSSNFIKTRRTKSNL